MREPLQLAWSGTISGAELYDGEDIETFATDWHFHEGWQLVAVLKGERRYRFRSGSTVARPGQLVVLPPRLVHKACCHAKTGCSFKIATLPSTCLNAGAPSVATSQSKPRLVDAFLSIFNMLKVPSDVDTTTTILPRLQEILAESTSSSPPATSDIPSFVLQIESYLLRSLDRIPSLELLSSLTGLSRYHFAHTFTKHVGLSPVAFHARARLMHARLLISQGWSLADTSLSSGFADQSHFGRHFRRVYGMTPGEYQHCVAAGVSPAH